MAVHIDNMQVGDADEAFLLMIHHLSLASRYFEATDEKLDLSLPTEFSAPAIRAWAAAMEDLYKD
jgi:hypothetical protein